MGWSIGYDDKWKRDIGYGVPAECDHVHCKEKIDRGLGCVCGGEPYGGEHGCGLYFCDRHLYLPGPICSRCEHNKEPFDQKPDVKEWIKHKLTDSSWEQWRSENPEEVNRLTELLEQSRHTSHVTRH